ncbi:DNA-processing protein DprA [Petroclostridium sp. X23]|uniref:DNA-processing protein DprA n=1 Tax=Petroclostridium sp. X23 TaxID=3045146 RepID=UPI0024ADDB34|nr:DNA-processing protein DprA [Petroclostridium sp. X23]WHH58924.1 DNA-processing protein DprA [Petroclostridium sp. X23]
MEDIVYWLWLTGINGIGSVKAAKLLRIFQKPEMVWRAGKKELESIQGIGKQDIERLLNKDLDTAKKVLYDTQRLNINIISMNDSGYPRMLKKIYDPPCVLYVRGRLPGENNISIAMVGARKASNYGRNAAEKIASSLAERGICIVSGMARGIDTSSHRGALKAGGKTAAVLGCGVDVVYPKENAELMNYIIKNGAVISEYPPATAPIQNNFPARNRIISGMTLGTIVVEAGERSGSLITVDFALEQGRDVFAVPGNIDTHYSIGTNNLIKQGAKMVTCIEDILEELQINNYQLCNTKDIKQINDPVYLDITDEEKIVYSHLSSTPVHIDELCGSIGYSVQKINCILTLLEMKGLIRQIAGKHFVTAG